jgi:acyl dehydratase
MNGMSKQVYYEDIQIGYTLPVLIKHPTPRQLVMWAGASGEFSEMHYDKDFALRMGFPGIIVHGMLMASFLAQLITNWMGEWGNLKKIKTVNRQFVLVDQDIYCNGKVIEKYEKDNEHLIKFEIWVEDQKRERCVTGEAIVSLTSQEMN